MGRSRRRKVFLDGMDWLLHGLEVNWLANMQAWQALPPEKRREQAWAQVPASVAASMAFERCRSREVTRVCS